MKQELHGQMTLSMCKSDIMHSINAVCENVWEAWVAELFRIGVNTCTLGRGHVKTVETKEEKGAQVGPHGLCTTLKLPSSICMQQPDCRMSELTKQVNIY